jgi:hypothetical protein
MDSMKSKNYLTSREAFAVNFTEQTSTQVISTSTFSQHFPPAPFTQRVKVCSNIMDCLLAHVFLSPTLSSYGCGTQEGPIVGFTTSVTWCNLFDFEASRYLSRMPLDDKFLPSSNKIP